MKNAAPTMLQALLSDSNTADAAVHKSSAKAQKKLTPSNVGARNQEAGAKGELLLHNTHCCPTKVLLTLWQGKGEQTLALRKTATQHNAMRQC